MELFNVINLDIQNKNGNLKSEAHSNVKSTKYFPTFLIDDKTYIFKPLSKTKPMTTPLFAYSEVYWSYIINKYFNSKTPRYYLANMNGMSKEQPKYRDKGVLVESLTQENEELINLYDYFIKHPEDSINIKDYINYCMKNYDYTKILESNFIKSNPAIGEELGEQILLSILRQDQNFHYENINFFDTEPPSNAAPIDIEISTPFVYPDNPDEYKYTQLKYQNSLTIPFEHNALDLFFKQLKQEQGWSLISTLLGNIATITKLYPKVVHSFIKKLDILIMDLPNIHLKDPDNYIDPLNSEYWNVGHARYKDNDEEKAHLLEQQFPLIEIDKDKTFKKIEQDILTHAISLRELLKLYLISYYKGINNFEELTLKELHEQLHIKENETIESIDIDSQQITLKKK